MVLGAMAVFTQELYIGGVLYGPTPSDWDYVVCLGVVISATLCTRNVIVLIDARWSTIRIGIGALYFASETEFSYSIVYRIKPLGSMLYILSHGVHVGDANIVLLGEHLEALKALFAPLAYIPGARAAMLGRIEIADGFRVAADHTGSCFVRGVMFHV